LLLLTFSVDNDCFLITDLTLSTQCTVLLSV